MERPSDGSIRFSEKDARFEGRVTVNGQPRYIYGRTAEEVEAKLATIKLGQPNRMPQYTVGDLLEAWISARRTLDAYTRDRYESDIRLYLEPLLGRTRIGDLTAFDIQMRLIDRMDRQGKAPRTIKHALATLRAVLAFALARWRLTENAVDGDLAEMARADAGQRRPLSRTEALVLMGDVIDDRMGALYVLCLATDLRIAEALSLSWSDVDLAAGTLLVDRKLHREAGRSLFHEPATQETRTALALPELANIVLEEHRTRQEAEILLAGDAWKGAAPSAATGLVFTTPLGLPKNRYVVARDLQKILDRHELKRHTLYDLRQTSRSLLLAAGLAIYDVTNRARQAKIAPRVEIAGHLTAGRRRETPPRGRALLT